MNDLVTWPRLLEWARLHGAVNDHIIEIKIATRHLDGEIQGVVMITGRAEDENGKPYSVWPGHDSALWSVTELLRSLP